MEGIFCVVSCYKNCNLAFSVQVTLFQSVLMHCETAYCCELKKKELYYVSSRSRDGGLIGDTEN